jgi:dinuclear metal center YbgI/SA1388 family protein
MIDELVDIEEVISFLESQVSPISQQLSWDNSGRQICFPCSKTGIIALALDPTERVIRQALEKGCGLLITHHPLFFDKFQRMDFSKNLFKKVGMAVKANLNLVSFHTNFDNASYNTSDYICDLLGAEKISCVSENDQENLFKFTIFVPIGFEPKIIKAIDDAGAGSIGNYKKCTFYSQGTGTFEPGENTKPFIGRPGKYEEVKETRLETIVKGENLSLLIDKVLAAHPYEEPAYDVYKLHNPRLSGIGTICSYKMPISLNDFVNKLREIFNIKFLRFNNMFNIKSVNSFAIIAGSGASMWSVCKDKGLDLLITGDLKHHDALNAAEDSFTIIDVGHFQSEQLFLKYIKSLLEKKFNVKIEIIEERSSINYREV